MTVDEYIFSLETTAESCKQLDWESLDEYLYEEYVSQIEWLLGQSPEGYKAYEPYRDRIMNAVLDLSINLEEVNVNVLTPNQWSDILSVFR